MNRLALASAIAILGVAAFASGRASVGMPGVITLTPDSVLKVGTSGKIDLCRREGTVSLVGTSDSIISAITVTGGDTAFRVTSEP